jgi:hypothetical protein
VAFRLAAQAEGIAAAAVEIAHRDPPVNDTERQRKIGHEDLVFTVQHLAAAALVDEPAVFTEYLAWLEKTLQHRGVPYTAVLTGLRTLQPLVATIDADTAQLLARCLGRTWPHT